jgi:hypothetical protein
VLQLNTCIMKMIMDIMVDIFSPIINSEDFDFFSRLCLNKGFDCRNGKCQTYGIHLCYRSEGLIIVNAMHLLKAFGNNTRFISSNMSIVTLGPIDPFSPDKFPSRRKENHIPSLVLEEGVVVLLHGGFPKGISNSLIIILWI